MKVKVGIEPEADVARVRAVREAIGPDIRLGVDANGGWSPREKPFRRFRGSLNNGVNQLLQGVLWGIAIALFFFLATRWLVAQTGQQFYSSTIITAIVPKSIPESILVILAMIPAVLVEELLFRSLLLGGLAPLGLTWILLLGFTVLFGILHSPQGIWGMVGAGLAGWIFGALFLWHNSLLTPTIAHYVATLVQIGIAMLLYDEVATENVNR